MKPTIGVQKETKKERRKRTLEELNDLVMRGKISEELYLMIRSDILKKQGSNDYGQAYV